MEPKLHDLKIWPDLFVPAAMGEKTFEIRRADRDFQVNDHLRLREWDPERQAYTGREIERRVTYVYCDASILAGERKPVIAAGFVVMSIVPVPFGQSRIVDQRPAHVAA